MGILDIVIIIFVLLELSNVMVIYFKPDFKYGNSIKMFKQWDELKKEELPGMFVQYMAYWVAGCKVIFLALLVVIMVTGSNLTKVMALVVLIPATALYYIKLHPIIKELDSKGQIHPKGYSKTQGRIIAIFIIMFACGIIIHLL